MNTIPVTSYGNIKEDTILRNSIINLTKKLVDRGLEYQLRSFIYAKGLQDKVISDAFSVKPITNDDELALRLRGIYTKIKDGKVIYLNKNEYLKELEDLKKDANKIMVDKIEMILDSIRNLKEFEFRKKLKEEEQRLEYQLNMAERLLREEAPVEEEEEEEEEES